MCQNILLKTIVPESQLNIHIKIQYCKSILSNPCIFHTFLETTFWGTFWFHWDIDRPRIIIPCQNEDFIQDKHIFIFVQNSQISRKYFFIPIK